MPNSRQKSTNQRSQIRNAPSYTAFGWKTWDHLGLSFLHDKISERAKQHTPHTCGEPTLRGVSTRIHPARYSAETQTASSTRTWAPKILPLFSNCVLINFPNREELSFLGVTAFPKLSSRGLQLSTLLSSSPTFSTTGILRLRLFFPSVRAGASSVDAGASLWGRMKGSWFDHSGERCDVLWLFDRSGKGWCSHYDKRGIP